MDERVDDLSNEEKDAFEDLGRRSQAPPRLEDQVVEALRKRGALANGQLTDGRTPGSGGSSGRSRRRRTAVFRNVARFAASIAIFLLGIATASWWTTEPAPVADEPAPVAANPAPVATDPVFALLLFESEAQLQVSAAEVTRRIGEYSAWATTVAAAGRFVSAEKLADDGRVLRSDDSEPNAGESPGAGTDRVLSGYFLIRAPDLAGAVQLARECPHLRYGGEVEVRRIEPT